MGSLTGKPKDGSDVAKQLQKGIGKIEGKATYFEDAQVESNKLDGLLGGLGVDRLGPEEDYTKNTKPELNKAKDAERPRNFDGLDRLLQ